MRIRKYDFDYSRRAFMEKVATGAGAGVLAPLWSTIAHSADDISKAYPDELLSIEMYTKGRIKPGDVVTADNVDIVKDLLEPICYRQVKEQGRRLNIVESTKDVTTLFNHDYLDVTLRNRGRAAFGPDGNVWTDGKVGSPWIGGLPFTDPKDGNQMIADMTLAWGKHDYSQYAIPAWSLNPQGEVAYSQDFVWCELNTTARGDGTVFNGMSDKLRLQTVFFTGPNDIKGSSFLSIWYYDQRKFPDLYGYFPAFKRVRQFPTNQRFEPLVPGITFFLSDAWAAGDPMLTWGNYKIVERKPFLGAVSNRNWNGADAKWHRPFHGGPKGKTFLDSYFSLVPEAIVLEAEPTGYPRAPVSKKRVWIDARNCHFMSTITTDRRGEIWKQFELGSGQFKNGNAVLNDEKGRPDWSWLHVHSHDIQSNRMSILLHAKEVAGGYKTTFQTGGVDVYNKFLTSSAIARLGQ
ncbi:secreted protein [Panacagrimonas perspica]|uniref:Secreted protein n=1 Tax=Panacagrimonas perspica TaxID=381431 RepID=A0A4S3K319_9GAMM|nr:DUF1329 domain-containing protein [Panacagrimonas perspica]TDU28751.1 secreted protein [Panacagrimonas perspica]THD02407.1 hypothetical protein B1810_15985 [Panacagrimonas perspica]